MLIDKSIAILTKVTKWLAIVSAICLAGMLLANIVEVVGSKCFNWSFIGYLELTKQLMVFVSIFPIAYVALERKHIRITMVSDLFSSAGRFALEVLGYILGIIIVVFCSWRAFEQMLYALNTNLTTNTLFIPIWPTNLVIVIGFGLLSLIWLLILIKKIVDTVQNGFYTRLELKRS